MYRIEATCKTVTPLIMGGADQKTNELRESAIKHTLRYWWRTFQTERNSKRLLEQEGKIFGNTQEASRFRVRADLDSRSQTLPVTNLDQSGIKYWIFPFFQGGSLITNTIKQGSSFQLQLSGFDDESQLHQILKALWLSTFLGGLGQRSRRGAGSFEVTKIDLVQVSGKTTTSLAWPNDCPRFELFRDLPPQGYQTELQNRLGIALSQLAPKPLPSGTPSFPAFSPDSRVYTFVGQIRGDALQLWNRLGQLMRTERQIKPHADASYLHKYAVDNYNARTPPPIDMQTKQAFGLPIQYHFKENFGELRSQNSRANLTATVYSGSQESRRASPLWISLHPYKCRNGDSGHFAIFTLLWSQFLGTGHELKWKVGRSKAIGTPPPDASFIQTALGPGHIEATQVYP